MTTTAAQSSVFRQFYALTKPRVIQLIVFCALIGMVLAVPGLPTLAQTGLAAVACLGIWLVAAARLPSTASWSRALTPR
ncbi:hypothetical protein [Candidatus Aalborgicola defluviihabitans]|uniref:hypothetical protein n=1 Tax=Candidatus Aalborgicola defluviihabitans TaxID=3386187 RepID=UPI0039B9C7A6